MTFYFFDKISGWLPLTLTSALGQCKDLRIIRNIYSRTLVPENHKGLQF